MRLAEVQKVGVWIDRRVDPSTVLYFEASNRKLGVLFEDLASSLDLGCFLFDSVAYLGPKESAAMLPVLIEARRRRQTEARRRRPVSSRTSATLRQRVAPAIPFLSEPREILRELTAGHGLILRNPEALPHDLWDANTLPEMPLGDLLTLLLIGFEIDYEVDEDGTGLTLGTLLKTSTPTVAERKTPATASGETKQSAGTPTAAQNRVPFERRRFTVRVEDQPLEAVLESLAKRLDLELKLDRKSLAAKGVSPERRVSFDVQNVGVGELFRTILKPLNLEFRRRGDSIEIR